MATQNLNLKKKFKKLYVMIGKAAHKVQFNDAAALMLKQTEVGESFKALQRLLKYFISIEKKTMNALNWVVWEAN